MSPGWRQEGAAQRTPVLRAPDWIRTNDTRFRRAVLYPLSYEGLQRATLPVPAAGARRDGRWRQNPAHAPTRPMRRRRARRAATSEVARAWPHARAGSTRRARPAEGGPRPDPGSGRSVSGPSPGGGGATDGVVVLGARGHHEHWAGGVREHSLTGGAQEQAGEAPTAA